MPTNRRIFKYIPQIGLSIQKKVEEFTKTPKHANYMNNRFQVVNFRYTPT